jgi:peptide subunit release factor 1 (eRF1)
MDQHAAPESSLDTILDRLARFEPSPLPVISLYLNLQADQHGQASYAPFLKKELAARARTYAPGSQERASFDEDANRIEQYLATEVGPAVNGLALFACSGCDGFFEAVPVDVPVDAHRLTVASEPHVYPLELLLNRHPRHAVVLADSQSARLFVFGLGQTIAQETVAGDKVRRTSAGGWSQMRYQRRMDNLQAGHVRDLVAALDAMVRDEDVAHIILAGDDVTTSLVKSELSKELAAKVIEVLKLEIRTPEQEVMAAAALALRRHDEKTDAEVIERVLGDYRAGGLAVAGLEDTRDALEKGQVDELYLTTAAADSPVGDTSNAGTPEPEAGSATRVAGDELVAKARQTSATVRFIEDASLLSSVGGVAAALRYRVEAPWKQALKKDRSAAAEV